MRSVNRINYLFVPVIIMLTLSACGGGGNNFSENSPRKQIQGSWISRCIEFTDGTSEFRTVEFSKESNGENSFYAGTASFSSNDCTGGSYIFIFAGPVSYKGAYTTPICTAEKIDTRITVITDGDNALVGDELQQYLADNDVSDRSYDLACKKGNHLYLGDDEGAEDGSTPSLRPTRMETRIAYEVWNRSSGLAKRKGLSIEDRAKQIIDALRSHH